MDSETLSELIQKSPVLALLATLVPLAWQVTQFFRALRPKVVELVEAQRRAVEASVAEDTLMNRVDETVSDVHEVAHALLRGQLDLQRHIRESNDFMRRAASALELVGASYERYVVAYRKQHGMDEDTTEGNAGGAPAAEAG